jgi:hypothetical protein
MSTQKSTWASLVLVTASVLCALPTTATALPQLGCLGIFGTPVAGSLREGRLVCAQRSGQAGNPNQRWSEMHYPGGTLGEWGRGSSDPAGSFDATVGTWSYDTNELTYNYGTTYDWTLFGSNSTTPAVFCDGNTVVAEIAQILPIPSDTSLPNPCGS